VLPEKPIVAYCDYIAWLISTNLKSADTVQEKLLASVGSIELHTGISGQYLSTKKTIKVEDRFGKRYRIIIEELNDARGNQPIQSIGLYP